MMHIQDGIYLGAVVHKRLQPVLHELRYSVFSILVDCDGLDELDNRLKLFSTKGFNLVSYLPCVPDGENSGASLGEYLRDIAAKSGLGNDIKRFMVLCYPRVLGYAFNPLTVYYGLDGAGEVRLLIYEVRNTFGEAVTYVLPALADAGGVVTQSCDKGLYVSPFNAVEGRYHFHTNRPGDEAVIGVALKTDAGPLMKAYFRGKRLPLTDANLLFALSRTGWMTMKVIVGIHYEAMKLWLKGLRVVPRPPAPKSRVVLGNSVEKRT